MGKIILLSNPAEIWSIHVFDSVLEGCADVSFNENPTYGDCYAVYIRSSRLDNVPALIEQAKPKLERLKKKRTFGRAGKNDNA